MSGQATSYGAVNDRDAAASPAARRNRRRRARLMGMMLVVGLPVAATGVYEYVFASDQYVSEFRFAVRQQRPLKGEPGGLAASLAGGNPLLAVLADSEVAVQYLKSRQVIDDTAARLRLDDIYGRGDADALARLPADAPAEKRVRYWRNMVDPFFDMTTGVVSVKVRAFSPKDALLVADTALSATERLVNDMGTRAHGDALAYAEKQSAGAEARLKKAEGDIAVYRNQNAVLFPQISATTSATLEGQLMAQLADARTTQASLRAQGVRDGAPQLRILENRIAATEREIADARSTMTRAPVASPSAAASSVASGSLASVLSGYSALDVEERIAEKGYEQSLIALQDARNEASQQQVYLDAFVRPALPEESLYPVRWKLMLEVALGAFATWCLGLLIVHGIKDQLD